MEYRPMPIAVLPMLAKPSQMPEDYDNYGFEIKWDGIRAIFYLDQKRLRITSRNLKDITHQYPELHSICGENGNKQMVLDGEIISLGEDGRPSFSRLQHRMNLSSGKAIRQAMEAIPVIYIIFDLIYLNGCSLQDLPYTERRGVLEGLRLSGPTWQTPDFTRGKGPEVLAASRDLGLEGVVAKRLDSTYQPGKRTGAWLKIRNHNRQEFVIGGWVPGQGGRAGRIGALLLGYYDVTPEQAAGRGVPQRLIYAGKVGTGFTETELIRLGEQLQPLRRDKSPFYQKPPVKGAVFVDPVLVAEIEFTEWTPHGTLRHPSFKGLRQDKNHQEVVRE